MKCPNCGSEFNDDVLFCPGCGSKIEKSQVRFCRKCGEQYVQGAKFCVRCGNALSSDTVTQTYSTYSNPNNNPSSSGYRTVDMNSASGSRSSYNSSNNNFGNGNSSNTGSNNTEKKSSTPLTGNPHIDQIYDDFKDNIGQVYDNVKDTTDQLKETAKDMYGSLMGGLGLGSTNSKSTSQTTQTYNRQNDYSEHIFESLKDEAFKKPKKKNNDTLPTVIITIACICVAIGLIGGNGLNHSSSSTSTNTNSSAVATSDNDTTTSSEKPQRNGFDESTNVKFRFGNYYIYIPEYWKVDTNEESIFRAYAETDGKTSMLLITYNRDEKDPVTPEMFHDENERKEIERIISETWFEKCYDISYDRFDLDAIEGYLYNASFSLQGYDGICEIYDFPSYEDNRYFSVILTQTDNTEYDYTDDYFKILHSIVKVDDNDLIIDSPYLSSTEETAEEQTVDEQIDDSPYQTDFDYAYKGRYADNYYCYYLIDVDSKKVVYFESTCPDYPYYGNFTGDTASQIKIDFPDDYYYATMTFTGGIGSGASVVIQDDTIRTPLECVSVEEVARKVDDYLK